jgi:hypothetical protein
MGRINRTENIGISWYGEVKGEELVEGPRANSPGGRSASILVTVTDCELLR